MDNPALVSSILPPKQPTSNRSIFFKKVFDHSPSQTNLAKNQIQPPPPPPSSSASEETKLYLNDNPSQTDSLDQLMFSATRAPQHEQLEKKKKKSKKNIFSFGNFSRNVSMTPYAMSGHDLHGHPVPTENRDLEGDHGGVEFNTKRRTTATSTNSRSSKSSILASEAQSRYENDLKIWLLTIKYNKYYKHDDPLTYSPERLATFMETCDSILEKPRTHSSGSGSGSDINANNTPATFGSESRQNSLPLVKEMERPALEIDEKIQRIGFWSLSALKFISNVDTYFTRNVVTEFSNFDLKENEKIRVLNARCEFYGLQWSWQLALDNPKAEVYDFTLNPIDPTSYGNNRQTIGPANFHRIHGESLLELSFSRNSFALVVAYGLWLQLKADEWIPVLTEMHRVLLPSGTIHMMLLDFDIVNCENPRYLNFFKKLQRILTKNGIDPFPCKHIQQRLKDSGFQSTTYSLISLKKGQPSKLGNLMDFLQGYFEFLIFEKIASFHMEQEDLEDYKEIKLQYHQELRSGRLLNQFGNSYCMFVFAKKGP
ncbi:hypothetical protein WICPIJ_005385 [Wickerhamomyces pijperi]|uniref:Methyltransferase type 11 domain-containing protein n=1 Tax=Wickerhamomyces pijperi TaxID=599730 RepID=A0A9P8Q5T4_WICPI|nr:hypothetical protein WICPIJ_005385 [Wickerhamomyces pijperi]